MSKPKIQGYQKNGWKFTFQNSGIMNSKQMDQTSKELNLRIMPSIYHGNSFALIQNPEHKFQLQILPKQCLALANYKKREQYFNDNNPDKLSCNNIDIIPGQVKIKYYEKWKLKKFDNLGVQINQIQQPGDSFLSSPYKGTISGQKDISLTQEKIPVHKLGPQNPIVWNSMIHMFQDELGYISQLGDNGVSNAQFRFRVMQDSFFGLIRHYLRVDDVLVRIYDTRIYHDFKQNYLLRQFTAKQNTYEQIKQQGFVFSHQWTMNPAQSHQIYGLMKTLVNRIQKIKIY